MSLTKTLTTLREFDTPLLANTIGYISTAPPHAYYMSGAIRSITPTLGPTVGVAVTCEIDTSTPCTTAEMDDFWQQADDISRMTEPVVWIAKAVGSRPDHECVLGDGMGKILHAAGCVGVVTDGGCRDTSGFLTTPIAIYCRGNVVHHTPIRIKSVNKPVEIGGITVTPGEVIHADAEGVISVPSDCLEQLAPAAIRMRAFESDVHCQLRRTDLSAYEKRDLSARLLRQHGFTKDEPPLETMRKRRVPHKPPIIQTSVQLPSRPATKPEDVAT